MWWKLEPRREPVPAKPHKCFTVSYLLVISQQGNFAQSSQTSSPRGAGGFLSSFHCVQQAQKILVGHTGTIQDEDKKRAQTGPGALHGSLILTKLDKDRVFKVKDKCVSVVIRHCIMTDPGVVSPMHFCHPSPRAQIAASGLVLADFLAAIVVHGDPIPLSRPTWPNRCVNKIKGEVCADTENGTKQTSTV